MAIGFNGIDVNLMIEHAKFIKTKYEGVLACEIFQDEYNCSVFQRLKLNTANDSICNAVDCFLTSERGKEYMKDTEIYYDTTKECFSRDVSLFHISVGKSYDGTAFILLIQEIIDVVKNDSTYFSDDERSAEIEIICKLLGEG